MFADLKLHSGSYIVTTTMYVVTVVTDMLGVISSPVGLWLGVISSFVLQWLGVISSSVVL